LLLNIKYFFTPFYISNTYCKNDLKLTDIKHYIMPFITFIYRIENTEKIFYGKYICDSVSDNYEGLDIEIKPVVINGINEYRNQK